MTCESGRIERLHSYLSTAPHFNTAGNTHVVFDMYGYTPSNKHYGGNHDVLIAAISFESPGPYRMGVDVAWPTMPILTSLAKAHINCSAKLKYFLTFKGTRDAVVRSNLEKLHDPDNGVVIKLTEFKPNIAANTSTATGATRE